MANSTPRLGVEQDEAALGLFADRVFVAFDPAVEWRLAGYKRSLEIGNRFGDCIDGDGFFRIGGSEGGAIACYRADAIGENARGHVHLCCGLKGAFRLFLQGLRSAVPEIRSAPS